MIICYFLLWYIHDILIFNFDDLRKVTQYFIYIFLFMFVSVRIVYLKSYYRSCTFISKLIRNEEKSKT